MNTRNPAKCLCVWVVLDYPQSKEHAAEVCQLANAALQRLNPGDTRTFSYEEAVRATIGGFYRLGDLRLPERAAHFPVSFEPGTTALRPITGDEPEWGRRYC